MDEKISATGQVLRRLKVDWSMLDGALQESDPEAAWYLDTETGAVLGFTGEVRSGLEEIMEQTPEEDDRPIEEILAEADAAEWEVEAMADAYRAEWANDGRYVPIPAQDSREEYQDMEAFIDTVKDASLRNRLDRAIAGRGAFRRFRDTLADHPAERERWFEFSDQRLKQRALEWLRGEGIEPENEPAPPPSRHRPATRPLMIEGVLCFVRAARQLDGVLRIALVGSLATDKAEPKDVDVLVTVADDMDLTPLATLGRKLQGHVQPLNRGADVFLADPSGAYLGRTCHWKECGPGIRAGCDAEHCGRRHYLHDDLRSVTLPAKLIARPPVELWPAPRANAPVPGDIQTELLEALAAEKNAA